MFKYKYFSPKTPKPCHYLYNRDTSDLLENLRTVFSAALHGRDPIDRDLQPNVILTGNNLETNLLELVHRGIFTDDEAEAAIKVV